MLAILLLQLTSCFAAIEYFTKGMQLRFYFPSEEEVTFELWVPAENLETYDWIGFALQDVKYPSNNFIADFYIALVDGTMSDQYANSHVSIALDADLGGSDDIESNRYEYDGYVIYTVSRLLETGDEFDTELVIDSPYKVMWAKGHVDEEGNLEHTVKDSGSEYIILVGDYMDRNHDDSGKFGPWTSEFQDFLNKVDHEALEEWTNLLEEENSGIEDIEDDFVTD